jgi:hypothetical protein
MPARFLPFEKLLCGPLLLLVLLFLYWLEVSVFSSKFRLSLATAQFDISIVFNLVLCLRECSTCLRSVLFIFGEFLHFSSKLWRSFFPVAVFRQNLLVNHVFVVGCCCWLLVIDVFDRPWCFVA